VGRAADILIVAARQQGPEQLSYYYDGRSWHQWFGDIEQLPPAQSYHQLPATLEIVIDFESLRADPAEYIIFLGYRLDNYIIVFNGSDPIQLITKN
ncbi:MAG: hypothetical protein SVR94_03140, partial [Pseudomonadota bacterium]|nr:hypothetical protein [Pseudomonadota bacterium]